MKESVGPASAPEVPWEFRLPPHFSREAARLQAHGIGDWSGLAQLDDASLRQLARAGGASEARLIKLRGQARLVIEVGVSPADAALLLYSGIASRQGLAQADPDRLHLQLGRFQRQLLGRAAVAIDPLQVRRWIFQARGRSSRSPN
ncbi:MAG: DUF4332 domain-containing protein [Cyanobium sp.]